MNEKIETTFGGTKDEMMMLGHVFAHYLHAKEKHPYFCDMVTHDYWKLKDVQENLARTRNYIKQDIERHDLDAMAVLFCEIRELEVELTRGDKERAIEECYDAIAVLLRVVDVLEGRQTLGKSKEGEQK